jgi:hypothetical protein
LLATALQILSLKLKIPSLSAARWATGSDGIFYEKNSHCGLNTFSRAFKSCDSVRQVSWLCHRSRLAMSFTVARPRGIHTRFPILPAFMRGT